MTPGAIIQGELQELTVLHLPSGASIPAAYAAQKGKATALRRGCDVAAHVDQLIVQLKAKQARCMQLELFIEGFELHALHFIYKCDLRLL